MNKEVYCKVCGESDKDKLVVANDRPLGYRWICKKCAYDKRKEYYIEYRKTDGCKKAQKKYSTSEKGRTNQREWQKKFRRTHEGYATAKRYDLKTRYGITLFKYNEMLEKQNHKCIICGNSIFDKVNVAVDHDHITGKIRGLLCKNCNWGLGNFRDNTELLNNAIKYLKEDRDFVYTR